MPDDKKFVGKVNHMQITHNQDGLRQKIKTFLILF